ncbi:MAG: deoxyribonuclease IV [Traorella sp.]
MILGSHVSMSSNEYVLGSILEMLSYDANCCMLYTGPPQNGKRVPLEKLKIKEAHELLNQKHIPIENIIIHAPYLINLANTLNIQTYQNSLEILKNEMIRCDAISSKYLILHPGSHVKAGSQIGIQSIIKGLNEVIDDSTKCIICLETMAGKGNECGKTFEELKAIIQGVNSKRIGVCLDTCHIHDAGYDLNNFDEVLNEFDRIIGFEYLKVVHLNDSKNILGSHKDRHENIGLGHIGFDTLCKIAHHPLLDNIPKILETPYIDDKAPYKEEIKMLKQQQFKKLK